ncbi:MAG TPA: hypothetical protein VND66_12415 [Acidobacteriaceae bacterium]|nr:hypothetical protein [Acidobacteriaceae bacterium]
MAFPKSLGVGATLLLLCLPVAAKVHSVALGAWRKAPYTPPSTVSSTTAVEPDSLRVRPLVIDGQVRDWTTGDIHEITDRTFVARRAVKLNDDLPGETGAHWLWELGPWLLVDRSSAHISVLRLPDFDPAVSEVVWFRDYAAYCGVNATGKHLYAVVSQLGVRRPLIAKPLTQWTVDDHPTPACAPATWQRQPLQVVFHPTNSAAVSYHIFGLASALVEDGESPDEE